MIYQSVSLFALYILEDWMEIVCKYYRWALWWYGYMHKKKNAWIFLYCMQYKFLVDMNYKNCVNFYIKCIKCIFPVMNKSLHAIVVKMCTRRGDQLLHCWNYCPQPHRAHIHCLFSKHWRMSVCAIFFSTWGNSIAHLCFIQNSMSDYILSDCHLLHTNKM